MIAFNITAADLKALRPVLPPVWRDALKPGTVELPRDTACDLKVWLWGFCGEKAESGKFPPSKATVAALALAGEIEDVIFWDGLEAIRPIADEPGDLVREMVHEPLAAARQGALFDA